ncbi:hypothetical protein [Mesorhizobium loti]|uniref:hypothetical protein n=1 Tax=Rhizobium loti TaxID=381 RepID=UPI0004024F8E|nr:hypothetical protein [Mesorhizobium loti]
MGPIEFRLMALLAQDFQRRSDTTTISEIFHAEPNRDTARDVSDRYLHRSAFANQVSR